MDVLAVTGATATVAADLQDWLLERGVPAVHPDALVAANAVEHGGTFATAEKHVWNE